MTIGVYTRHADGNRTIRVPTYTVTGDETETMDVGHPCYRDCPAHKGEEMGDKRRGAEFL